MAKITVNGIELFYQSVGKGPETIVFLHGYLMNHSMFKGQVAKLSKDYRCISFEHRGHGQSEIVKKNYSMQDLVDDAIAFVEALDIGPVHFVGMSAGGFVGMRIALQRPNILKSLVLLSTSAEAEPLQALKQNNLLLNVVNWLGWWPVIAKVLSLMFHPSFLQDKKRAVERDEWRRIVTSQDKKSMVAFGRAIFARNNVLPELAKVNLATVVIVGAEDAVTPLSCSEKMADTIPSAELHVIPDSGHSVAIEKSSVVAEILSGFYKGQCYQNS